MNRQPFQTPPRWWGPRLTPWWVRCCRPFRERELRRKQRIRNIQLVNPEVLRELIRGGNGVLITPNHSTHYDSTCLYAATERAGVLCHFMTAWQVFGMSTRLQQWSYQRHGCFSIDRENTDVRAFKQSHEILQAGPSPLVIFPEGDIHHVSERIMPFRDGAAAIALMAAKKSPRPIYALPCGIRFRYVEDPLPSLQRVMAKLEDRLLLRLQPERPLAERILRVADVLLTIKEIEYLGQPVAGQLPVRLRGLADAILQRIAASFGLPVSESPIPERVKELRRKAIVALEQPDLPPIEKIQRQHDLEDLFLAVQLYSYPGNYLIEHPSPQRMAETIDKLEEDVLEVDLPTVHAQRDVVIQFGEPMLVQREAGGRNQTRELTAALEGRVQGLLTQMCEVPVPLGAASEVRSPGV